MQFTKWFIALPLAVTALSGCSLLERLVYRIDINQGNYVDQQSVNQLKFGMSKDQVRLFSAHLCWLKMATQILGITFTTTPKAITIRYKRTYCEI